MKENLKNAIVHSNKRYYKEELISRIRDLIDGYTSRSLLKEYLQNADDAGATELIVTFDETTHESLRETPFEAASGKALLIANNSLFSEKDFQSISEISAQGKKNDPEKTGRFGQGFSSSFSISDHPSFVSNGRAVWIDPTHSGVAVESNEHIFEWNRDKFSLIDSWLTLFHNALDENESIDDYSIFRLPIRTGKSEISNDLFSLEDFIVWFNEWKGNAQNLLFLRHIRKLVLRHIDASGHKRVLLEIVTQNSSEVDTVKQSIQAEFKDSLQQTCEAWISSDHSLPLHQYLHHFVISQHDRTVEKTESWAVVNGLFRGPDDCLIEHSLQVLNIENNKRKVLPWAGAAMKLDQQGKGVKLQSNAQWYLFLPLPEPCGYPVHLHGWFDSDSKRERRTYEGDGADKKLLIEWNRLLA